MLYSFAGGAADGAQPIGPVIVAQDARLYGTTFSGGANNMGTVYRIGRKGHEHVLHSFAADGVDGVDGTVRWSGLLQASNGRFYGMTSSGGPLPSVCNGGWGCGTIYEITEDGRYHVLHAFTTGTWWPAPARIALRGTGRSALRRHLRRSQSADRTPWRGFQHPCADRRESHQRAPQAGAGPEAT